MEKKGPPEQQPEPAEYRDSENWDAVHPDLKLVPKMAEILNHFASRACEGGASALTSWECAVATHFGLILAHYYPESRRIMLDKLLEHAEMEGKCQGIIPHKLMESAHTVTRSELEHGSLH